MQGQAVLFSKKSDEWSTPDETFNQLDARFKFTLDAAASAENAKCSQWYDIELNSLLQDWGGHSVWLNPPYSNLKAFMRKAREEGQRPNTRVVCLVPARTDTQWWHDNIPYASEVWLIKGRLKFGGQRNAAPFPSAVIVFDSPSSFPIFYTYSSRMDKLMFLGRMV